MTPHSNCDTPQAKLVDFSRVAVSSPVVDVSTEYSVYYTLLHYLYFSVQLVIITMYIT